MNIKNLYKAEIDSKEKNLVDESINVRKKVLDNIDNNDGAEMIIYDIDQGDPELHSI
nr:MAG TPA: hypothetical protein [Caudoviricetes sp.]